LEDWLTLALVATIWFLSFVDHAKADDLVDSVEHFQGSAAPGSERSWKTIAAP